MVYQFPELNDELFDQLHRVGIPETALKTLKHMVEGGESSRKGSFYETMFTVHRFLQASESALLAGIGLLECPTTLSNIAPQFVDDLVVIDPVGSYKWNFQLKNSTTTGRVNQALRDKFAWQEQMDRERYPEYNSWPLLVCSDQETVDYNDRQNFDTLYFPYYKSVDSYLRDEQKGFADDRSMTELLQPFCPDPNQLTTALDLLTVGVARAQDLHITVGDWWEFVLDCAKPNIFTIPGSPRTLQIPPGVTLKLANLGFTVSRGVIDYVGMEFSITEELVSHLSALPESVVAEIETPAQMLEHLENASQLAVDVDWLPPQAPLTSHSPTTEDDL